MKLKAQSSKLKSGSKRLTPDVETGLHFGAWNLEFYLSFEFWILNFSD